MAFVKNVKKEYPSHADKMGDGKCVSCDCETQSGLVRNGCGCSPEPTKVYPCCSGCFTERFSILGCRERGDLVKALREGKAPKAIVSGNAPSGA